MKIEQLMNSNRKLATITIRHCFTEHKHCRLNRDSPMFERVKYLYDYGTDNCNPVFLGVSYEASGVMLSVSLPFQRAHLYPLEKP
jgi:hypothetical protein